MTIVDFEQARGRFLKPLPYDRKVLAGQRFALVGKDLIDALTELYGRQPGFADWLLALFQQLGHLHGQRSTALAALDVRRECDPEWLVRRRMLGYSAYVDRFADTLRGVAGKIDHLRALGVDYLHLLPFLRMRRGENDGGFAVASFAQVEPALGTMDDLEDLSAELRKAGISLCADLVLNHVADEHPWAQAAIAGDPAMRSFFHIFPDRTLPDAYDASLQEIFPQTAPGNFTQVDGLGWVWTTFYPYQWDLNYAHPPVFTAMVIALLSLANRGVEVFRLDSAPFLWKRQGTDCVNQPEVHLLLAALRACTRLVAPGVLLKAEAIMPTSEVVGYFGRGALSGRECHLAYHTGLMAAAWVGLAEGSAALPSRVLAETPATPAGTGWITYVRCHDDIVWSVLRDQVESMGDSFPQRIGRAAAFLEGRTPGSFARGAAFQAATEHTVHGCNGMTASLLGLPSNPLVSPDPPALRRFVLLHALAFWVGAIPVLYMGDELGQTNNDDPADAARIAKDGRWLQRPRLTDLAVGTPTVGRGVPAATFAALNALTRARRDPRWPARGAVAMIEHTGPDALLLLRRGSTALAAFNFGKTAIDLDLEALGIDTGWSDLYAGEVPAVRGGKRRLDAWSVLWQLRAP